MTDDDRTSKSVLLRGISVLDLIADYSPRTLGVTRVAELLNLPKAVAHRILKDLVACDYLAFDESTKQYTLGSRPLTIGLIAVQALDVPALARPEMRELASQVGETVTLSMRVNGGRIYVEQVVPEREIRMTVSLGTRHPLYAGSSSKAILAAMREEEVTSYLGTVSLEQLTGATITSVGELLDNLARVRKTGYASSSGERQSGASSVAAPVWGPTGDVWGSVSVCGPSDRFGPTLIERLGGQVAATAVAISRKAGYVGPVWSENA